jgi:ADP-ribose pyrophosphatase YjhB (NUDIX family)
MAKFGVVGYFFRGEDLLMLEKGIRKGDPNSRLYTVPGGKLEEGETPEQRMRLECPQETGLKVKSLDLIGTVLFNNKYRTFKDWKNPEDYFCYVFRGEVYEGELRETEEGKPLWVPKNLVDKKPQHEGDIPLYIAIEDGRKFSAVITHRGEELDWSKTLLEFYQ